MSAKVNEVGLNACFCIAVNNLMGGAFMRTVAEAFTVMVRYGTNYWESVSRFIWLNGFPLKEGTPFIPYWDRNSEKACMLGLRKVKRTWGIPELSTLPYSPKLFNRWMSTNVKGTRAIICMDKCAAAGDLLQTSHALAATYSKKDRVWYLEDNVGGKYPTLKLSKGNAVLSSAKISDDLRTTFQQFMRVSVWELVRIPDSKLKSPFPYYVKTLTENPAQSLSELFFGDKRRGNPALKTPGTNIRERRSNKSSSKASQAKNESV